MRSKEAASGRFCKGKIIRQNSKIYLQEDKNMSLTVRVLFVVTLLLSIVIPFGYFLIGQRTKKRYKRAIGTNVFFFFSTVLIAGNHAFCGRSGTGSGSSRQYGVERNRIRIPGSSTFNRSFLRRRWYRRCKCSKCGSWVQLVKIPVHLVSH